MKNVSFKSVYAIPHNREQNPVVKNYADFLTETAPMRETDKKSRYDKDNSIYYIYIRDENDKKFENYALRYGINYRKANSEDTQKAVPLGKIRNQIDDMIFLTQALSCGAKSEIKENGNIKEISLYDLKGEHVIATYFIDKSKGNGGQIVKKTDYIDGKTDCIHEYDDNGNYKKSVIYGDKVKMEFTYDKEGNPILKK